MAAARSNLHHVLFFDCDVNFFWRENTIFGAENQKFRLRRDQETLAASRRVIWGGGLV